MQDETSAVIKWILDPQVLGAGGLIGLTGMVLYWAHKFKMTTYEERRQERDSNEKAEDRLIQKWAELADRLEKKLLTKQDELDKMHKEYAKLLNEKHLADLSKALLEQRVEILESQVQVLSLQVEKLSAELQTHTT